MVNFKNSISISTNIVRLLNCIRQSLSHKYRGKMNCRDLSSNGSRIKIKQNYLPIYWRIQEDSGFMFTSLWKKCIRMTGTNLLIKSMRKKSNSIIPIWKKPIATSSAFSPKSSIVQGKKMQRDSVYQFLKMESISISIPNIHTLRGRIMRRLGS